MVYIPFSKINIVVNILLGKVYIFIMTVSNTVFDILTIIIFLVNIFVKDNNKIIIESIIFCILLEDLISNFIKDFDAFSLLF
jgi:membrane-anchored protein YejM (alkaline phosphatase superfamily)